MKFIDLTGQKFGILIVIKYCGKNKWGQSLWLCKCDCGKQKIISGNSLRQGITKSCGCKEGNLKHGYAKYKRKSRIYNIWADMNRRCNNKNRKDYKYYGGRNSPIIVCYRWSNKNPNGYINFLADIGEIPEGKEIDRTNNDKGYSPENCKLSTRKEQMRNIRTNRKYNFNGEIKGISTLAEEHNINKKTLIYRLDKLKMSIEEALTIPVRKHKRKK